jgi:hypothetical protein
MVGVIEELVEEDVGCGEFADVVSGQDVREAFLPVIMAAFDFAFGLGSWGEEEFDAIEVESGAELGESVWIVSVEEGVKIDIKGQRQSV